MMNARVHDARVGGGVSIGGGWMDEKRTARTVTSASPGVDIQRRISPILTANTGLYVGRSTLSLAAVTFL